MTFIIVFACIVISGLLSAAEIAFVTARRSQIRSLAKDGNPNASLLRRLRENPERTLSVIQLGESLVTAIAAAVGFIGTAKYLSPWLIEHFHLSPSFAQFLSVAAIVMGFTYLDVVFGELVPKVLALRHPLWVAMLTSRFLLVLEQSLHPLVSFLEWSTRRFVTVFDEGEVELEALPDPHRHLVLNAVALEKRRVEDIYLPWENVDVLHWNQTFEEVTKAIADSLHTRLPVLKDGKIEGILNSRDFTFAMMAGERDWHQLLRKAATLQQSTTLLTALKTLRGRRNQVAIVFKGHEVLGIVTMQDIFDQIVGDIYDENDEAAMKQLFASSSLPPNFKRKSEVLMGRNL